MYNMEEELEKKRRLTVMATPNPGCPVCTRKMRHNAEMMKKYHPDAGKGFSAEHGTKKRDDGNIMVKEAEAPKREVVSGVHTEASESLNARLLSLWRPGSKGKVPDTIKNGGQGVR